MGGKAQVVAALDEAIALARPEDGPALIEALERARELAAAQAQALSDTAHELNRLTCRYIAQQRLFEDLDLERICDAVSDVVVNLLGSEEFVVFLSDGGGHFYPVRVMGPEGEATGVLDAGDPLPRVAREGRTLFDHQGWVALAPLADAQGATLGLVALRSLLAHKPSFTQDDRDVLEDLRRLTGRALGYMLAQKGKPA